MPWPQAGTGGKTCFFVRLFLCDFLADRAKTKFQPLNDLYSLEQVQCQIVDNSKVDRPAFDRTDCSGRLRATQAIYILNRCACVSGVVPVYNTTESFTRSMPWTCSSAGRTVFCVHPDARPARCDTSVDGEPSERHVPSASVSEQ